MVSPRTGGPVRRRPLLSGARGCVAAAPSARRDALAQDRPCIMSLPGPVPRPLLCLVAAVADNGVIGRGNALPWRLPADLAHFRRLTLDKTILMGRRTWESLPGPLPRRRHLILTRDPGFQAPGGTPVGSLAAALAAAAGEAQLMIVGGASLYAQTLARADRFYLTRVHAEIAGDTRFPPWAPDAWQEVARLTHPADERNSIPMTFLELHRIHAESALSGGRT